MTRKEALPGDLNTSVILVVSGMFVIGLIDTLVIKIAEHGGLWQFHFMRAMMAVPVIAAWIAWKGLSFRPRRPVKVLLRTLAMTLAMLLYFGALPILPISSVVAGLFTAPIFVMIFSVVLFDVAVGWVRVAAALVGFVGVFLVLGTSAQVTLLLLIPVGAGVLYALNTLTLRHWCAQEETAVLLMWFFASLGTAGLIGTLVFSGGIDAPFALRGWIDPSFEFLVLCAIQAFGSTIAVGLLTRAYQTSDPSYLSIFEYSLIIFASFWAFALFDQQIGLWGVVGIVLIVASGIVILIRSR